MRTKNIGMEHATIAATIEQVISSVVHDPTASPSTVQEILHQLTQCLQNIQPKPLSRFTMKFDLPTSFASPTMTRQQLAAKATAVVTEDLVESSTTLAVQTPCTPAPKVDTMSSSGNACLMKTSSNTRSKVSAGKRTNNVGSTPPPSTITIPTTTATPSMPHQKTTVGDIRTESVSAKSTSSSAFGKPPLVPTKSMTMSTTVGGSMNTSAVTRSSSVNSVTNSNNKRANSNGETGSVALEQQATLANGGCASSSSNGGGGGTGRPSSPSLLSRHNHNTRKRQRRSTSMNSSSDN
jgi:hypothetical protein